MDTQRTAYQPHVGLQKVFPPDSEIDKSTVDIIAIHGLDTDSPRTWTYTNGHREIKWLEDKCLLPAAVPYARIYTYNWDAKVFNNAPVETIFGHADRLLDLVKARQSTPGRPILFIASCLGGLVLAEAITRAAQEGNPYRQVLRSTVGIVFLATPFFGTDAARKGSWFVVVKGIMGKDPSGELIKDLEKNHDKICSRVQEFSLIANTPVTRIPIWCFYETKKTKIMKRILGAWLPDRLLRGSILVERNSACIPGFQHRGLGRTHVMMNKFEKDECPDYTNVRSAIQLILNDVTMPKEQRDRLLASIKFTGMNEWKNRPHEGTFPWIFHTSDSRSGDDGANSNSGACQNPPEISKAKFSGLEYRQWHNFEYWLRSEHNNTYWISGKLGSGKTTLVKYLTEHPATMKALSHWAENPVIISHFFWKAGTVKLQRDIKGCLCSIIYQALELAKVSLGALLLTHKYILRKTSHTDWSPKELRSICLDVLAHYPSPVCIFLDGLDEICIEDRSELLEFLEKFRAIPHIKTCLASRSEPYFESACSKYPNLRLQDLTFMDIEKYASKTIQPYISNGRISSSVGSRIMDELTYKADGVFLWLRLAVSDLVRGLQNVDSEMELYARLQQMPSDLYKLYEDIWTRINEDSPIYREDAALYFKLAISSKNEMRRDLKLLHLAAATTDLIGITSIHDTMNAPFLEQQCSTTMKKIQQRCIGLLELVPRPVYSSDKTWDAQYAPLLPYWRMRVQFPHRTAYDFFTNGDTVSRILGFDSSTSHDLSLRLLKADLITLKLVQRPTPSPCVQNALDTLSQLVGVMPPRVIDEVLEALRYLYDNEYFDTLRPKPHFLAIAASFSFKEFVLSGVETSPDPALLATDILRYLCSRNMNHSGGFGSPGFLAVLGEFWEPLLKLEANPSSKGIIHPYMITNIFGDLVDSEIAFLSPIGSFLRGMVYWGSQKINENYKQLLKFLRAEPDLQERIPILAHDDGCGLSIGVSVGEPMSHYRSNESVVVLDLDLKFLVGAYSERARKSAMTFSTDGAPYRPSEDLWSETSIRIALTGVVTSNGAKYYECSEKAATKQLLNLMIELLYGDGSEDLTKKVRYELNKIEGDIWRGSSEYVQIKEKSLNVYLASRKLGRRFVNEAGVCDSD
ncbi:hypothetical protein F4777DRAFT_545378 [Nemania sp. FL0916]|nr:hypothetical protein F4777DRAFT_545378 [Nemania sp. FL0916]